MSSERAELLPCAWCGGPAKVGRDQSGNSVVWCDDGSGGNCPVEVTTHPKLRESYAIAAWNTRRAPLLQPIEPTEEEVERVGVALRKFDQSLSAHVACLYARAALSAAKEQR